MSNGILDELLNDPEAVFGDARIRTRFDTVAVNITGAEAVPSPDPDPELEDGQVKLQRSDAGDDIFDGEGAIADALDAASGGDTILVGPGTFEEVLTIATANIKLTCDSPDETTIVGRIVIEAGGVVVSNLEIESGGEIDEVIEVSVDVSGVTVVGCVFTVTTEGVRVIEIGNGDDITIEDCEFDIDVEIERVIFVRDGSNITIDGCEFEVVNEITITRFIVVEESAVDVTIVRCVFVGKVELEVIVLEADDSRIEGCDFDGVIKIDLTIQLVLIDADNVVIIDCDFEIDVELRRVILVRGGSDVTVDDCDFEIIDGVTIERLIVVNSNAVDVLIVRCVFIGSVTVTTIEHNGTGGGSAIRDCDFDEVELDDATLIIRVDDVTIEEVEIQIVEIQIKDEFEIFTSLSGAINAAEEGAKIIVRSGTYAEEDSITIATPDLEIRGPQAGTSGGDSSRSPNDPETEAIIESRVFIEDSDVVLDGFSLREGAAIDPFNPGKLAIDNNVINGANRTPIRDGISAFIFDGVDVSIIGNRISSSETGIRITSQATGSEFTDAVEIADNTIEETDTGIDLTDTAVPDGGIETVRANNTFRNTDTEVVPELADLFVDKQADDGDDDAFQSVFAAIEAASSGDEIAVAQGEYEENEFIAIENEGVVLRSTEGREQTTIKNGFSLGIQADDVKIRGFSIVPQSAEVGIFVGGDVDDAVVENNTIDTTENESNIIGIDVRGNSVTIVENTITTPTNRDDIQIRGPDSSGDIPERVNEEKLDEFDNEGAAFDAYLSDLLNQNDIDSIGES